ncbi:glycosyltransferase family 2 protein [Frondihabitans cladoniiphilus]|uniref:Glycosyltransferase family 2 protein n=1 Tax=Frondihabitans cladoniiphilus TaxID=715785 RepID=A0ABP8VY04_9MICO
MTFRTSLRPSNPTVSIIIPTRNEAKNLEVILPKLPQVHEVILVDGNSVDGTVETALRLLPDIKIVHQTRKGKGNALACGFEAATGDIIVMFDADGSADSDEIPRFVKTLTDGADVAKGSRFRKGGGSEDLTFFRSTGNLGLNMICNVLLGTKYSDLCYGYNAFWRDILPALDLLPSTLAPAKNGAMLWGDGFEIETILTCRMAAAKLRVTEVPSFEKNRIHGESNLNAISDGIRVLKTILDEKRRDSVAVSKASRQTVVAPSAPTTVTAPIRIEAEQEVA